MHIKVHLNEDDDHFFGFFPDTAKLHLAAEFDIDDTGVDSALHTIYVPR